MTDRDAESGKWLTLPNVITTVRILCSPGLILVAWAGQTSWLAALAVFLVFTEWVDGFLARRMRVTSAIGARLDTVADAVFYSCLLVALVMLSPAMVGRQKTWIAFAVASYLLSWLISWLKFRQLPSYHTWGAKGVWVVVGAGIVCLVTNISPWPFRIAMICVAAVNLEAICITLTLSESKVDVPTLWHALRRNPQS